MSIADAYVCTSVGDTTPSVCLAALGCGTPLIGFDYEGVTDCAPNEFGTYVPIGDIDALAKVVAATKKKTNEDIEKIRAFAIQQFSPESVYKKQVGIYKDLIKS
jgi:glycosyltransferase involved in cell wall biosynthesis